MITIDKEEPINNREDKKSYDAISYRYEELFQIKISMWTKFTTQTVYTTKITHNLQHIFSPTYN